MNQETNQEANEKNVTEADKKSAIKWYPIAFNSFSVSTEKMITNILDH